MTARVHRRPLLIVSLSQFTQRGFTERKILLICDVIRVFRKFHDAEADPMTPGPLQPTKLGPTVFLSASAARLHSYAMRPRTRPPLAPCISSTYLVSHSHVLHPGCETPPA